MTNERRTKNERTDRTHTRIVSFIVLDVQEIGAMFSIVHLLSKDCEIFVNLRLKLYDLYMMQLTELAGLM